MNNAFLRLALAGGLVGAPVAFGEEIILPASADVTLYENLAGDTANGSGEYFFIGRNAVGLKKRSILRFDVAGALPAGGTIEEVTLTLHMSRTTAGPFPATLHRAIADWGEGDSNAGGNEGSGAPAREGDATWLYRFFDASDPSSSPAWDNVAGDFDPVASASTSVGGDGQFYTWSSPAMARDVQDWLDDPSTNFGWFLLGDEQAPQRSSKRFDSRTNPEPGLRPALTIVYSADEPCPPDLAEPFGVLDLADAQAFVSAFAAGDPVADFAAPDGIYDLADVQAFLAAFSAGCP